MHTLLVPKYAIEAACHTYMLMPAGFCLESTTNARSCSIGAGSPGAQPLVPFVNQDTNLKHPHTAAKMESMLS